MTTKKTDKPKKPAARAPRRKFITIQAVLHRLEDQFAKAEFSAGREKLWLLAQEYFYRRTTCGMLTEALISAGIDVDAVIDVTEVEDVQ